MDGCDGRSDGGKVLYLREFIRECIEMCECIRDMCCDIYAYIR